MNRNAVFSIITVALICLCSVSVRAGDIKMNSWSSDSNGTTLDHGDVIIHGNNDTEARITPDGVLHIAGKSQAVTATQKQQLISYVNTVKDMEARGDQLGLAVPGFLLHEAADALDAVFGGASDKQTNQQAHQHAHDFAQKTLPICKDAHSLKQLQDALVTSLPTFKPYAVIEGTDTDNCEQEINSTD